MTWICKNCYFLNQPNQLICFECNTPNQSIAATNEIPTKTIVCKNLNKDIKTTPVVETFNYKKAFRDGYQKCLQDIKTQHISIDQILPEKLNSSILENVYSLGYSNGFDDAHEKLIDDNENKVIIKEIK